MSPNNQAEIAVAMDNCVDALDAFIAIVDGGVPVNHILEVTDARSITNFQLALFRFVLLKEMTFG